MTVPSNLIEVTYIIILPSTWYICDFCLFQIEIEGKCGWIIGGPKGMLPPLSNYWGGPGPPAPPLPTPMHKCKISDPFSYQVSAEKYNSNTDIYTFLQVEVN